MARHVHVVRAHRPPHRQDTEAHLARNIELVAGALAAVVLPLLHADLPTLPRSGFGRRAAAVELPTA